MSEEEQATAIGRAIQTAMAAKKLMLSLAAEIDRAAEAYKIAHEALRQFLAGSPGGRDIYKAISALPDPEKLRILIREYEETASRHAELAARAEQLSRL
ncbi:MAG TPA: hypothetical protein VLW65_17580 [Bryobacteraceae bacterium]|nr:hypothetical protein [Bryobacteraceae bacterium]